LKINFAQRAAGNMREITVEKSTNGCCGVLKKSSGQP
jgi:hypothetical protein